MTLSPGARLGPYEILASLGAGGMGEIYRARDSRLGRTVAIKILPQHVVDNPSRRQRFEREARAASRLSHPHICALYDIGEQGDVHFIVMEFLEGETLGERLRRGRLPISEVLRYAIEVADALDHAHREGIVHRDLKPANIMLTRAGAKLLDFGVARLTASGSEDVDPDAERVTETQSLTGEGTILGTLQYMAPEQMEGREVDARTDIFALGTVVYEMATAKQAFAGTSRASVIAAILAHDPPSLSSVSGQAGSRSGDQSATSPVLDHVIARCLAKNPDERWQTAADLRQELKWIESQGPISSPTVALARGWRRPRFIVLAASLGLAIASLATLAVVVLSPEGVPPDARAIRLVVSPPENGAFSESSASLSLSPDGNSLAFLASSGQVEWALWIRSLDSLEARPLPGTAEASQPFWSADSRFLAFVGGAGLKKIDVTGGLVQTLAEKAGRQSGTWNREGVIVFRSGDEGRLYRVPEAGGPAMPVTTLDHARAETAHTWPQFLPDGRHYLYLARSSQPEHDSVAYLASLDSVDRVRLFSSDSHVSYAAPGFLVYMRGNTLVAHPFDARALRLTGEPVPIAEQVERTLGSQRGAFSVSQTGVLAYRPIAETQLVWFDRGGRRLEKIGVPGHYRNPALSPDERRVAVARVDLETGTSDIWLIELARGIASRFTFDAASDEMPLWSPDGSRIVFKSRRTAGWTPTRPGTPSWNFYEKASSGTGAEVVLQELERNGTPHAWHPDGRSLVYSIGSGNGVDVAGAKRGLDLWLLPVIGDRKPVPLLQTQFFEWQGAPSPDGRWIAYVSDESGRNEVYVRPFAAGEGKWQVSVAGGIEPAWRSDGRELFYLASDRNLMAVPITTGSTVKTGAPIRLFETTMTPIPVPFYTRNQYVATADGQRFLINQPADGAFPAPITVVVNWPAALKK